MTNTHQYQYLPIPINTNSIGTGSIGIVTCLTVVQNFDAIWYGTVERW